MAFQVLDRVQETTTTTGTGTVTLGGAVSGFQTFFNAGLNNGDTTYYCITSGTAWEVGLGTYASPSATLARTTILASSASGSAITLAGTSNVFCVYPAGKSVYRDSSGNVAGYNLTAGTINSTTVGATTASTGAFTTLSASSTVSGTGFSTYLASPPAIGGTIAAAITGTTITANTQFSGPHNGTVGATTPNTGAFTTLSASSTVSGAGFSTYLASPPAIGGTAAAAGTFTTVVANTSMGIGGPAPAGSNFYNANSITGSTTANANTTQATVQSGVTASARGYATVLGTAASAFTLASLRHFYANQAAFGVGSTVNTQSGYYSEVNLIDATVNYGFAAADTAAVTSGKTAYGFYSAVNTATGGGTTWGFYAGGTANNLFVGNTYHGAAGITPTAKIHMAAGTATANTAPLKFTAGTNLTTAEAGAMEYDGKVSYFSGEASQPGVVNASQFVILTSSYVTPLGTADVLKQAFNATTNGTLTLTLGSYLFECHLNISGMSGTSGTLEFGFGGTALGRFRYIALANKAAATTTAANTTFASSAAVTVITPATTSTVGYALIKGSIVVTTAGTIIPSIALSVAAACTVVSGSYFILTPIGSSTVQTVGNWS